MGATSDQPGGRLPDCFTEVLRTLRLRSSIFFRSELSSPWGTTLDAGDIAIIPTGDEPQCRLICGLFHFDIDEPHPLMSLLPHLLTWRMRNARELLLHSRLGLEEVAERVGYSSATSLSGAYKRFFGETPRAPAKPVP